MLHEKKFRILLAEDDAPIRESLMEILVEEGFECIACEDGKEASEKLLQEKFDLLITDFHMPRMTGADLLEWCQEQKIHLPVIIATANKAMLSDKTLKLKECCADVIEKPIDFNQLIQSLEKAKARKMPPLCRA